VRPATFALPDPARSGDFRSCRLLRDAARLGVRAGAGPFRSSARLNVEPRPYQLVPLLMGLKLDPVRLLIADDVGIGKTIEAALLARELLDRGEIHRLAVLCPPHLAEQWQEELNEKFNIAAELVLPSTVTRLERHTAAGQSLFDLHPFVIVSTDYIKSSRRRDDFVRSCPEFVIVDEAHTCAFSADQRGGRHLRHQLISALARDPARHLVLVTATPHSGDEGAFRSLLGLLRPEFLDLPEDLTGPQHEKARREVAQHLVQRRRADIRDYLHADTVFPSRAEAEFTYTLTPDYARLFRQVLDYARERVADEKFNFSEKVELLGVQRAVASLLRPNVVLDMLANFTLFATDKKKRRLKLVARYQQYEAANQIVQRVLAGAPRKGLIWHFQGSGKSLLMVFAAQKLRMQAALRNPTVLIVVDRVDLDAQISATFHASDIPNLVKAESREELERLLRQDTRKIIITTSSSSPRPAACSTSGTTSWCWWTRRTAPRRGIWAWPCGPRCPTPSFSA